MKPYYDHGGITIYHGDCREILPTLPKEYLVLTDPPYGINYRKSNSGRGRWHRRNQQPIIGDETKFDPSLLITFSEVICWGANHYCHCLPQYGRWLVWDKLSGLDEFDSFSDFEIAWHSKDGPERIFHCRWKGICRTEDQKRDPKWHPSEKPVSLMRWCINQSSVVDDGLIVDPYMGSGTTLRAAKDLGRKSIGIEIEECYCDIAARRLSQEVLPIFTT